VLLKMCQRLKISSQSGVANTCAITHLIAGFYRYGLLTEAEYDLSVVFRYCRLAWLTWRLWTPKVSVICLFDSLLYCSLARVSMCFLRTPGSPSYARRVTPVIPISSPPQPSLLESSIQSALETVCDTLVFSRV